MCISLDPLSSFLISEGHYQQAQTKMPLGAIAWFPVDVTALHRERAKFRWMAGSGVCP